MLASLGSKIWKSLSDLDDATSHSPELINKLINNTCSTLIEMDVDPLTVKSFRSILREKSEKLCKPPIKSIGTLKLHLRSLFFSELENLFDSKPAKVVVNRNQQTVIVLVGLQGSGKTTTISKLAHYYLSRNYSVGVVCADTYRAGAYDQLHQNCIAAQVEFYGSKTLLDPASITLAGLNHFKNKNLVLIDTSGRNKQEESLFEELERILIVAKPTYTTLILDCHLGQSCKDHVLSFAERCTLSNIILTKLDGNKRCGAAITAVATANVPIWMYCAGEGLDDIGLFKAKTFVTQILDSGQQNNTLADTNMFESLMSGLEDKGDKADFNSLRSLLNKLRYFNLLGFAQKMGSMLPFFQDASQTSSDDLKHVKKRTTRLIAIIDSMTPAQREMICPISSEQDISKLARGSGTSVKDVKAILKLNETLSSLQNKCQKLSKKPKSKKAIKQAMHAQAAASKMKDLKLDDMNSMANLFQSLLGSFPNKNLDFQH